MYWFNVIRRLWRLWQLRKLTFRFCGDCGMTLTPSEGTYCTECAEPREAKRLADAAAIAELAALRWTPPTAQWSGSNGYFDVQCRTMTVVAPPMVYKSYEDVLNQRDKCVS